MNVLRGRHLPLIYSVFARNHGRGGLSAVTEDIPRIAGLGVDYIWLMPFHPTGHVRRKGSLGSPYAIRDHRAVDPALGDERGIVHLTDTAHRHGVRVMIDIVFNHVSPDSVIASRHPEWLWRDGAGNPGPRIADWSDVVDLDYSHRELWDYQVDTMAEWLRRGVDGFRCDVAPMVPVAFWEYARGLLDPTFGRTLWLAESADAPFEHALAEVGAVCASDRDLFSAFDLCYDYGTYPELRAVHNGSLAIAEYLSARAARHTGLADDRGYAVFLENHDHDRAASFIPAHLMPAWLAYVLLSPGAALLYAGEEYGLTHTPDLFNSDPVHIPPARLGTESRPIGVRGASPNLIRSLAALRRGSAGDPVTLRLIGPSAAVIEWGARRRTAAVLDLDGTARSKSDWPVLPGVLPRSALYTATVSLAPGVGVVTFSETLRTG